MLSLKQIINESDVRVPNHFDDAQKVSWLNEVNQEFFEIVSIPKVIYFNAHYGTEDYLLPPNVHGHNITRVTVPHTEYASYEYENTRPNNAYWTFDDEAGVITLHPAPFTTGDGVVRYSKKSSITYLVSSDLNTQFPEAPDPYHQAYILGLCERIAKAMNDVTLANNYGADYRNQLMLAQAAYMNRSQAQKEGG